MKPTYLLQATAVLTGLFVASCSLPQMAQRSPYQDDVYVTRAEAQVYTPAPEAAKEAPSRYNDTYNSYQDPYYGTSDYYYGMDYANRIHNFYQGGLWRPYYDNYYASSFLPWYTPSLSFGLYYNSPFGFYSPWLGSYRFGYFSRYAPFWGGMGYPYYMGGGYFGGGLITGRPQFNPNYGPRPIRGREGYTGYAPDRIGYGQRPGVQQGRPADAQGRVSGARPGDYSTSPRPARESAPQARPERIDQRPTYTPPPSSSGSSSGSSGSGSSSSAGRPGRG